MLIACVWSIVYYTYYDRQRAGDDRSDNINIYDRIPVQCTQAHAHAHVIYY